MNVPHTYVSKIGPEPEPRWCAWPYRHDPRWRVERHIYHARCEHSGDVATFRTWEAAYTFARQEAADARRAHACGVRLGWHRDLHCERPRGHYGDCAPAEEPAGRPSARSAFAPHAGGAR